MALGTIEILALIVSVVILLKLLIIIISRNSWVGLVKGLYSNKVVLIIIELVLSGIVFYYLLQELTLVQIMACVLLGALLTGLSFAFYSKELISPMLKMLKQPILKKAWLLVIIWAALAIWTLTKIF